MTGKWTPTDSLTDARQEATGTLLPNGKLIVAGGYNSTLGLLRSAELYDSASGGWKTTGNLASAR